jgi:glycosyltransferase involved in cell wall biosynthesis
MRIAMLLHKSVEFDSRVRREASALAGAGHEVTVIELTATPVSGELDGFARRPVLVSEALRRRLPFSLYRVAFAVAFVRQVVEIRPQAVHAHDAAMLLPGLIGARLTGARLVYDSHELATSVPYRRRAWAWFVGAIERLAVPRCAAVITVSDGIAERLAARYHLPATPVVVRNVSALKPHRGGQLRAELGIDRDAPLVLHQGAPAPARGCELLVDAAVALDGVQVAFLGDPEPGYGEILAARIRKRGVADRVHMLPSVPLGDLLDNTSEADVGVTLLQDTCENHRLALPNKLFEYVAAGVPIVASALPETERLVARYGLGWCVTPGDTDALASALRDALARRHDPDLRLHLTLAAQELTWSREQSRLVGLYEDLACGRPAVRQARAPA